jgi:signal transduction histidine kinase
MPRAKWSGVRPGLGVLLAAAAELRLLFHVRDSGTGIAPGEIPRLFQAYAQADLSTTRNFGGTGLGLVIAQRLAELLGGGITVQSVVGKGTTFTVAVVVTMVPAAA